jgi:hypothetical protein
MPASIMEDSDGDSVDINADTTDLASPSSLREGDRGSLIAL